MTISGEKSQRASYEAARLARLERALSVDPDDRKLRLQVATARKRAEIAQGRFIETLSIDYDLINYRIIRSSQSYSIEGIGDSLISFQNAITSIYDSVTNGPKARANYSSEVRDTTRLGFGYSYPGSVGFVLTVQSARNLFGGSFDDTATALQQFFEIETLNDALDASRTLGLAAVSEMYKWVRSNAIHGNSVDLNWRHSTRGYSGRMIDLNKFEFLERLFAAAEEREVTRIDIEGILVGLDVRTRRFHFVQPNGESYKGPLAANFVIRPDEPSSMYGVPKSYHAEINRIETRTPATGKVNEVFELVLLSE